MAVVMVMVVCVCVCVCVHIIYKHPHMHAGLPGKSNWLQRGSQWVRMRGSRALKQPRN